VQPTIASCAALLAGAAGGALDQSFQRQNIASALFVTL